MWMTDVNHNLVNLDGIHTIKTHGAKVIADNDTTTFVLADCDTSDAAEDVFIEMQKKLLEHGELMLVKR